MQIGSNWFPSAFPLGHWSGAGSVLNFLRPLCFFLCILTVTYYDCQQRGACFGLAWDLLVTTPFSRLHFAAVARKPFLAKFAARPGFRFCSKLLPRWFLLQLLGVLTLSLGTFCLLAPGRCVTSPGCRPSLWDGCRCKHAVPNLGKPVPQAPFELGIWVRRCSAKHF